ncbi:MAG: D-alanyl-D-alanine carboxypeptidase family protein, partial [Actinomycetota bacterium]
EVVEASPLVLQTNGSDIGLQPGMRITVRDLLYALMLKSANDAGMALAAHHPLGYEHFIALMNQKARSLGARNTHLRNPHGLDQIGHVSSAYDMALFTRELLMDPALSAIVATKTHRMQLGGRARVFDHHHKMIGRYPGAVGVKTGFTEQAGHCLITAARTAEGIEFTVVMGSQNHYADTTALLDYGKALEVREASGGGGVDVGPLLPAPPALPREAPLAAGALRILDPRDDARWLVLMLVLTGLTLATVGLRPRSNPLRDAADVLPWLERLVPPSERR